MTASPSDFAQLLRTFRVRAGLSQEALAERAGLSARGVSDIERGLRIRSHPETLRLLADALTLSDTERAALIAAARPGAAPVSPSLLTTALLPLSLPPLPIPLDSLIGRDAAIAALAALLSQPTVRLITLTGPGGVGKTRLASTVATKVADRYADGVALLDLAPLATQHQVAVALARLLGPAADAALPPLQAVIAALRNRSLLVLFDNFEHVLDAAPMVTEILANCRMVDIVCTSRIPLRLRGEHCVPVAPLEVPVRNDRQTECWLSSPAMVLFRDRARQADPAFVLDGSNAESVAELCRRLDGLPLAIELAAARTHVLPIAALVEWLPTLDGGMQDAPARHRSLRDTIAWSYDLLTDAQQAVLRALSVFSGGFSLESARAVASNAKPETTDLVLQLAEASLIAPLHGVSGEARFTLLETIQQFAAERLRDAGERDAAQRRHAEWFHTLLLDAAVDLRAYRNTEAWYQRIDLELPNVRRAIEFLLANGEGDRVIRMIGASDSYWVRRSDGTEMRPWLESAYAMRDDVPAEQSAGMLVDLASIQAHDRDVDQAIATCARLQAWAGQIDTPFIHGLAATCHGAIAEWQGNLEEAAHWFEIMLARYRESGRDGYALTAMLDVANARVRVGEIEAALPLLDEGIALARERNSTPDLAMGLTYRGFATLALDQPIDAAASFAQALDLCDRIGMYRFALSVIGGIAGAALAAGDAPNAARLLGSAESAARASGLGRPINETTIESITRRTRATLGDDQFAELACEGASLTWEAATTRAQQIAAAITTPR